MNWSKIVVLIIACLPLAHCLVAFLWFKINEDFPILYTPVTIYKMTKMNWFGSIMVYILLFPFSFIFEIGGFLKWLFTVGRKD